MQALLHHCEEIQQCGAGRLKGGSDVKNFLHLQCHVALNTGGQRLESWMSLGIFTLQYAQGWTLVKHTLSCLDLPWGA